MSWMRKCRNEIIEKRWLKVDIFILHMRIELFDILRGISISGMIIFHAHYMMLQVFDFGFESQNEWMWRIFGIIIAITFITLSGYVNALSNYNHSFSVIFLKSLRRSWILAMVALGISMVTYIFIPEQRILWGIIHFFALSSIIQPFFSRLWWWVFPVAFLVYFLWDVFLGILVSVPFFIPFWIMFPGYYSADYYPLFPWFSYMLLGQGLFFLFTKYSFEKFFADLVFPNLKILAFLGRHSLIVYVVHTPILYVIFSLLTFIL